MQLCRKCSSTKLEFSKIIGYGEKMGKVFHYKIKCKKCGTKYMTERTKEVYERVKDKKWILSKAYKKYAGL